MKGMLGGEGGDYEGYDVEKREIEKCMLKGLKTGYSNSTKYPE